MGGAENEITLITQGGLDRWPRMPKEAVSTRLAEKIADAFAGGGDGLGLAVE